MIDVGQQLGGYTILKRIGRGGMGDVFLAQHRRVARRAAVKVLIPELSQKATVLDRFFNEARATSLIKHAGIVEILDCDVLDGQAFIIMEFLDGESLGAYLHRTGPLQSDMRFFVGMGAAVASAVGAAHLTGIIHRDLKPDNVYLHLSSASDPAVTVKVLDFGIAKLTQQDGGPSQTSTGMLLGTPAYMSPEQCRGAGRVDARSDIYSLGCILYEALLGWPPFVREGMGDLIIAHVSEEPEPPLRRIPGLSPEVNALVLRMLAKNADDRPQSMEAVTLELAACARTMGVTVERLLVPTAPVERPIESIETGPTQARTAPPPPTPLGSSGRGTIPLRPAIGSGPVPSDPSRTPAPGSGAVESVPSAGASGAAFAPSQADDSFGLPQPRTGAGSTRVLERPTATTFSSAASEIGALPPGPVRSRRSVWIGASVAAVLVLGGVVALVRSSVESVDGTARSGATASAVEKRSQATEIQPRVPPSPSPAKVAEADSLERAAAAADQTEPTANRAVRPTSAPSDTVRIEIQGAPPRTLVLVDGKPGSLPVVLPHGTDVHRIVLRPPGAPERVLQIDGTKDRFLELVFDGTPSSTKLVGREPGGMESGKVSPRERAADKETGRRSSRGAGMDRRAVPEATDREAITDL